VFYSYLSKKAAMWRIFLISLFSILSFSAQAQSLKDTTAQLQTWYQNAALLLENYQFDEALKVLTNCYHYAPDNADYLLKIAYCHQQLGRYRDAKIYYNEVLKQDSTNARALSAHASIATREANYRAAQSYYDQLIILDSTNSYYYKQAAYTALRRNAVLPAVSIFLDAHRLNPDDLEVIDQLVDIYIALDDLPSAEQLLKKGLNLDHKNIKLLRNKARVHQKKQENEAVVETVNQVMEQGDTADYYQTILGVAYLKLDSLDQGIFHLEKIVDRDKADDRTFHYLGLAYFQKEDLEKSKEYFELAIEAGVSSKMDAYHGDLAILLDKQKKYRPAIEHYKKALEYRRTSEYVFHLGHVSDLYYKDKNIAMKLYQEYLASGDKKYRQFTTGRVEQLREHLHFQSN
jgi:tetratricopeptide (TPR) repeat protein